MLIAAAVITKGRSKKPIGVKLVDTDKKEAKDVGIGSLTAGIKAGIKINNCSIDKYGKLVLQNEQQFPKITITADGKQQIRKKGYHLVKADGLKYIIVSASGEVEENTPDEFYRNILDRDLVNVDCESSELLGKITLRQDADIDIKADTETARVEKAKAGMVGKEASLVDSDGRLEHVIVDSNGVIEIPYYAIGICGDAFSGIDKASVTEIHTGVNTLSFSHFKDLRSMLNLNLKTIVIQTDAVLNELLDIYWLLDKFENVVIDIDSGILSGRCCYDMIALISNTVEKIKISLSEKTDWEHVMKAFIEFAAEKGERLKTDTSSYKQADSGYGGVFNVLSIEKRDELKNKIINRLEKFNAKTVNRLLKFTPLDKNTVRFGGDADVSSLVQYGNKLYTIKKSIQSGDIDRHADGIGDTGLKYCDAIDKIRGVVLKKISDVDYQEIGSISVPYIMSNPDGIGYDAYTAHIIILATQKGSLMAVCDSIREETRRSIIDSYYENGFHGGYLCVGLDRFCEFDTVESISRLYTVLSETYNACEQEKLVLSDIKG